MESRHGTWRTYEAAVAARVSCGGGGIRRLCRRLVVVAFLLGAAVPCGTAAEEGGSSGIVSRIRREPVESRALAAVGYSRRLRALEVEFRRGGTYRYLEVPSAVYRDLLAAESKAGFYNRNVRGKYRSVYVRPRRKQ